VSWDVHLVVELEYKGLTGCNSGMCLCTALTGRGANGRNPMALWGERGPLRIIIFILGVFVTREHVRHNKSGITHRGKTRISH
jgi:hypothetical protein